MSGMVINYAAVRFLPYRETDEFVNVGVIVFCPQEDRFEFKFIKGKSSRVRRFFPELNKDVLPKSLEALKHGLSRLRKNFDLGESNTPPTADEVQRGIAVFRELVQPRESILHFSPPGSLVADSWESALDTLYERYVDRRIAASPQEQERKIQQRLGSLFKEWHFRDYYVANQRLGDNEAHATWNLVSFDPSRERNVHSAVKAFKALSLDREDASDVYFVGDAWIKRVDRLRARGFLPKQAIFTLQMPDDDDSKRKAADEIKRGLESSNVVAVTLDERERLRTLADVTPKSA